MLSDIAGEEGRDSEIRHQHYWRVGRGGESGGEGGGVEERGKKSKHHCRKSPLVATNSGQRVVGGEGDCQFMYLKRVLMSFYFFRTKKNGFKKVYIPLISGQMKWSTIHHLLSLSIIELVHFII
ncbi:hypothetical protein E2542_SST22414 [Spatholobus suberectus]|nr:hypothetical protein E2542_SST22414 [Spatholobus suberectus]